MSEREKENFMKKIIAAALFVLLVVSLLAGCTIMRYPVECGIENIYLLTNTEKYRKDEEISPTPETKLTATLAKNEGEGMQFVYRPDNAKKNVRVTISDLVLDGGTEKIEDVTLYYQYYHYISQDYVTGRGKGWYPDLLIPISGDCSDLNKLDIEENTNQGYWITFYSDKNQTPGLYKAEVTVEAEGDEPIKIPVEVTVWDFAVPEEHSFDAPYGVTGGSVPYEETYEYLLRYRINGYNIPTVRGGDSDEDAAKKTAEYIETHPGVSCFRADRYTKGYFDALEKYGVLDKCFTYPYDEPADTVEMNKKVSDTFASYHALNPNVKNMITTASRETMFDVNIWCGVWSAADSDELTVRDRISEGYEMWWYGCLVPVRYYPTYHIQDDLISARLAHWMTKDWGFTGNLYWGADWYYRIDAKTNRADGIRDIYNYPGTWHSDTKEYTTPAGDGFVVCYGREGDGVVNRNMIMPTLRAEAIRDGSEDFEYLTLLEKKIGALFEKWGVTDISLDTYLDTYFDSLYISMSNMYRDSAFTQRMRERIAHDIMHAESAVSVEAAPTFENPNRRAVTVYAENGSNVVIDGENMQGESRGDYSVYTRYFDMNNIADRTEITVTVNGEEYTRVLKTLEDMELMEESRAAVQAAAEELKLPIASKTVRKLFEKNSFKPYEYNNMGSTSPVDGTGISDNREYAQEVWKCLALDIKNTIPLAVMNEAGDLLDEPKAEYLTLYVPNGATVKVEGKDATFVEQTENYSVYSAKLDTTGSARYFYDVEVTLNGVTETWRKIVFNQSAEMSPLINMSAEDIAAKLAAEPKNAGTDFEVIEYEGAPAIKVTINAEHSLSIPKSLIPYLNLKLYKKIIADIVNVSDDRGGFAVSIRATFATPVTEIEIPSNDFDGFAIGGMPAGQFGKVTAVTLLYSTKYQKEVTLIIRGLYAMKNPDDAAQQK